MAKKEIQNDTIKLLTKLILWDDGTDNSFSLITIRCLKVFLFSYLVAPQMGQTVGYEQVAGRMNTSQQIQSKSNQYFKKTIVNAGRRTIDDGLRKP